MMTISCAAPWRSGIGRYGAGNSLEFALHLVLALGRDIDPDALAALAAFAALAALPFARLG